ncbi:MULTISPECIES: STAS domain-containing protein [unclassified Leptolyngbya]|uniref:slr1659 superfamily regulator n=1 Tax=unclassified Leptolyngbya TaxID=2650499 RepID=UPI0018EFB286|nr:MULTISPECIES: STAS domain-containing protein [unclassified Leptolyngbya]
MSQPDHTEREQWEPVEIKTDEYSIIQYPETSTVVIQGFLRLDGMEEYQPIMDLLLSAVDGAARLTLDLTDLEFLNSSGISTLSMFVVKVRERKDVHLVLKGSEKVLWQTKSLKNLQRLMPSLTLEYV